MTVDQLIDTTTYMFNVKRSELLGSSRVARVVEARQSLAWALRQSNWSLESIGDLLHRDHTTIIYALRVVDRKSARNPRFAEKLAVLQQQIEPPIDLQTRVATLEIKVAELEALLTKGH